MPRTASGPRFTTFSRSLVYSTTPHLLTPLAVALTLSSSSSTGFGWLFFPLPEASV